jgi:hypothetical protein
MLVGNYQRITLDVKIYKIINPMEGFMVSYPTQKHDHGVPALRAYDYGVMSKRYHKTVKP